MASDGALEWCCFTCHIRRGETPLRALLLQEKEEENDENYNFDKVLHASSVIIHLFHHVPVLHKFFFIYSAFEFLSRIAR